MEIRSVSKAIRLLNLLGEGSGRLSVSELGRIAEMDKSSVSRMMRTLEQAGYVEQDPVTQRYALGLSLGVLGYKALRRMDLRSAARPMLERMTELTGECSHLAILADGRAFYIDQAVTARGLGMDAPIGTLAPLYCTALGKALLAFQPEEEQEEMIQGLVYEPFTRRTLGSPEALRDQLVRVRATGVAFDDEEFSVGVRCMATPVFCYDGSVVGAIGISGPSPRVTDSMISVWEPKILEISRELSARLGWSGEAPFGPALSDTGKKDPVPAAN